MIALAGTNTKALATHQSVAAMQHHPSGPAVIPTTDLDCRFLYNRGDRD